MSNSVIIENLRVLKNTKKMEKRIYMIGSAQICRIVH